MIAFLLFVQDKVVLPPLIQSIGRLHPLILHFPIVLMIGTVGIWFFRNKIEAALFNPLFNTLLSLTVCSALLSSLLGFFLSRESGYDGQLLFNHKYFAIAFAFLSYAILGLHQWKVNHAYISVGMLIGFALMILSTHFGAQITHGKGFITQPLMKNNTLHILFNS